jgi:hypothetical protein
MRGRLDPGMIMTKMTNLDESASLSHLDKESKKNDNVINSNILISNRHIVWVLVS